MALKFAHGAEVVIGRPLIGKIEQIKFNEDTGVPSYRVGWTDAQGEAQHRWFSEDEISSS